MPTFKHSGDLGDIIFALPTIRAMGGGVLLLDPTGGEGEIARRTKLTDAGIEFLRPLLERQPYLREVAPWRPGQPVDFNLNVFRRTVKQGHNLADAHLLSFGLPTSERDTPWLTVDAPVRVAPFVMNRTVRYTGNFHFWVRALRQLPEGSFVFVGLPKEHEIFQYTFPERPVPYHPTPSAMDLARVIAGCDEFAGNASLPHALAEAMKKTVTVEYDRVHCRVRFERPGARYV